MALNHFRGGYFKAKHFGVFARIVAVIVEPIKALPFWVKTARGKGRTVNTGDRFYYKSK